MKRGIQLGKRAVDVSENVQERGGKSAAKRRYRVRKVLARLHQKPARQTLSDLVESVKSSHALQAEQALRAKQVEVGDLTPFLHQAMYHPQLALRMDALRCLLWKAPQAEASIEAIEMALGDENPDVRAAAVTEMKEFPAPLPESLLKRMIMCVWDSNILVRKAAAKTMRHHPHPRVIAPLMGLLGTPDDELRAIVIESLKDISSVLGPAPSPPDVEA